MPRIARLVIPNYPHHVTQRGNRRQQTFFEESDYVAYVELLCELKAKAEVEIWAYCLMPNHVHFVAVPQHERGLAKLFGVTHHRYARRVNSMHDWRGHLWQERFHSCVMDDEHLLMAVRYIELNPVRAGICARPEDWRWSSVHAHQVDSSDALVTTAPMRERISDWRRYLSQESPPESLNELRELTQAGRPAGDDRFLDTLEEMTGRQLRQLKPGPDPRS
jgi:putative transposase